MTIALYDPGPNELKHMKELLNEFDVLFADLEKFLDLEDLTEEEEEAAWNDSIKRILAVLEEFLEVITPLK